MALPTKLVVTLVVAIAVVVLAAAWSRSNARVQSLVPERTAANAALAVEPRPVIAALPAPRVMPPAVVEVVEPAETPAPRIQTPPVVVEASDASTAPLAQVEAPDAQTAALMQAVPPMPPAGQVSAVLNPLLAAAQPRPDPRELTDHDIAIQELVVLERRLSTGDVGTATAVLDTAEPVLNDLAQVRVRNARNAIDNKDLTMARSELLAAIGEASRNKP